MHSHRKNVKCEVCGRTVSTTEAVPAEFVRDNIAATIRKEHPDWPHTGYVCFEDLNRYRAQHIEDVLHEEIGEVSELERAVVSSIEEQETLTTNLNEEFDSKLTFGSRVADRIADFGGSWTFIILFLFIIAVWMTVNSVALLHRQFDPFPFILLNLVLSCVAAIQAPVILMSQNRQESRDRLRAESDYRVNLKAELEIRTLHEKLDHLLTRQWERLVEIQQVQMELIAEMARRAREKG